MTFFPPRGVRGSPDLAGGRSILDGGGNGVEAALRWDYGVGTCTGR
jgi:hypothetical protein